MIYEEYIKQLPKRVIFNNELYKLSYYFIPEENKLSISYRNNKEVLRVNIPDKIVLSVKEEPIYAIYSMLRVITILYKYILISEDTHILIDDKERLEKYVDLDSKLSNLEVRLIKELRVEQVT